MRPWQIEWIRVSTNAPDVSVGSTQPRVTSPYHVPFGSAEAPPLDMLASLAGELGNCTVGRRTYPTCQGRCQAASCLSAFWLTSQSADDAIGFRAGRVGYRLRSFHPTPQSGADNGAASLPWTPDAVGCDTNRSAHAVRNSETRGANQHRPISCAAKGDLSRVTAASPWRNAHATHEARDAAASTARGHPQPSSARTLARPLYAAEPSRHPPAMQAH